MKFLYEYRTSDNARHTGIIAASDRDAAFQRLRGKGIRPSRLTEAPGFFNLLFGKGKRWLVIGVLAVMLVAVFVALLGADRRATLARQEAQTTSSDARLATDVFDSPTRRQIIGDAAIIEQGIRTGWANVFAAEGDRFLASFAIPGEQPAIRSTTESAIRSCLAPAPRVSAAPSPPTPSQAPAPSVSEYHPSEASRASGRKRCAPSPPTPADSDPASSLESRQIIAIVGGMKAELRQFIADGGSIRQYGHLLVARQEEEIGYRQRAKTEYERALAENKSEDDIAELLTRLNESLRKIGVKPLVKPHDEF